MPGKLDSSMMWLKFIVSLMGGEMVAQYVASMIECAQTHTKRPESNFRLI